MVDGLFFFQALSLVTEVGAISLVSREKEKLEPVVREKENTNPWLARSLQKSKHLVANRPCCQDLKISNRLAGCTFCCLFRYKMGL